MFIYVSGFISGRLIKPFRYKDINNVEQVLNKVELQNKYKTESQIYIDSANSEMLNYSVRYYNLRLGLLPKYYVSFDNNKTEFNKENFFRYYSLYKITDYLSKSKSIIINDMLIESENDSVKISF